MNAIYGLAGSFVGIFIPIYLLEKNLDPGNVFGFYFVYTFGVLIFFFLANGVVKGMGLKKTVLVGYPFLFLYFFLLYTLNQYGTPLWILALVNALQASLYWFPLHMWLAGTSREKEMGSNLAKFFSASQMLGLFAPVAAAFVVLWFGFKALFVLAGLIYLISAIPLLFLPEFSFTEKMRMGRFFQLLKEYPWYVAAEIFENIREDAQAIIWPVFIYLSFRNILSIGFIGTIGTVGTILFNLIVGKYVDKARKRTLLGAGALIMVAIWIFKFFTTTPTVAYTLTLAEAFFGVLIMIPINAMVYGLAQRENPPTFILFREFAVTIGRIFLYLFAFFMIQSVQYIFIFTAIACLGLFYISTKDIEKKVL